MRWFVVLLTSLCAMRAAADEPSVHIAAEAGDPTQITATYRLPAADAAQLAAGPLDEAIGRRYFSLALIDEKTGTLGPPIFGNYSVAEGMLLWRPAFGLARGSLYRISARDPRVGQPPTLTDYRVPLATAIEPAVVRSITPSGDRLPANVLRFYVTFSRPMREGREVLEHIRLYDEAGNEIASPWRDIELWNADATRLSLFLHPGRIKQGVNLREQLGPLLLPNRKYAIVIGGRLRDEQGALLGRDLRHAFSTTAEVRTRIDVAAWRVVAPLAGTREPLYIEFDRSLDAALALRLIRVLDAAGTETPGAAKLSDGERAWLFTPAAAWRVEKHVVQADPLLEDQAGNTPVRVFDRDLNEPTVEVTPLQLRREFTPR